MNSLGSLILEDNAFPSYLQMNAMSKGISRTHKKR